jgi:hypothetical protein
MVIFTEMRFASHELTLSMLLISAWLVLLFSGWAFGGLVYLLLLPAAWLFPWREIGATGAKNASDASDASK